MMRFLNPVRPVKLFFSVGRSRKPWNKATTLRQTSLQILPTCDRMSDATYRSWF